jgi:dipeptidyl aminopeptidase/acylaminoacyl peptidase
LWTAASNGQDAHQVWAAPSCYFPPRGGAQSPVPRWNSAGTELAIGVSILPYEDAILVVHADGKDAHYVADPSGKPLPAYSVGPLAWSPDGKNLAFFNGDSLVTAPAAGGRRRVVADLRNIALPTNLSWSPDGRTILASAGIEGTNDTDVEAFPASGGTGKLLYRAPGHGGSVSSSPDGKRIVFTASSAATGLHGGTTGIRVANADGSRITVVPGTTALGDYVDITSWFRVSTPPGPMAPSAGYWVLAPTAQWPASATPTPVPKPRHRPKHQSLQSLLAPR